MTENENKAERDELVRDVHQLLARALGRVPVAARPITRRAMRGDVSAKEVPLPSPVEEEQLSTYCGYAKSPEALESRIVAYCLGTLGQAASRELRAHASTCDFCRDRLEAAEALQKELEEGRAREPDIAQGEVPVAAAPRGNSVGRPVATPSPLEVVFCLLSDPRYLGGVFMKVLRPIGARARELIVGAEGAPALAVTRSLKGATAKERGEPKLRSSIEGEDEIGPLGVHYVLSRLEDGYRLELQITEADGRLTTRELLIERSVRGVYAGADQVVGGKHPITLPSQFTPLELTFYEHDQLVGAPLVIREVSPP